MKKFFQNKFDIVVSIGEDCACTSYLRRCNLQHNSYPFDWLTNAPLKNRVDLLVDNFIDFFNIEDFKSIEKNNQNQNDKIYDLYENTKNKFYFYHDFPADINLCESFSLVQEKYNRRIQRLYQKIQDSKTVLFVWLSHSSLHSNKELCLEYERLKEKFKNQQVYLLTIENYSKNQSFLLEDNHLLIINHDTISDDKKHHYDNTMGNKTNNLKIFKKIKLNLNMKQKFKIFFIKMLLLMTSLIFIKKVRQKIKLKINQYFYHAKL